MAFIYFEFVYLDVKHTFDRNDKFNEKSFSKINYKSEILSNGIEVLSIKRDHIISECTISIRTGSYNDTRHGIAHFLEHMLFKGTEKYPNENVWDKFINENNGYTNAFTAHDITVYHFQVDSNHFVEALTMFVEFFKTPIFNENCISREICAIDSEFMLNYIKDWRRIWRLVHFFYNKFNNVFGVGNKKSLLENDKDKNELSYSELRQELINFWKNNYDSKTMKLVIRHNEFIHKKIKELFETITHKYKTMYQF